MIDWFVISDHIISYSFNLSCSILSNGIQSNYAQRHFILFYLVTHEMPLFFYQFLLYTLFSSLLVSYIILFYLISSSSLFHIVFCLILSSLLYRVLLHFNSFYLISSHILFYLIIDCQKEKERVSGML